MGLWNFFFIFLKLFFSHKQCNDFFLFSGKILDRFPSLGVLISILAPVSHKTQKKQMGLYAKASRGGLVLFFSVYLEVGIEHESIQPIWGASSTGEPQSSGCCTLHYRSCQCWHCMAGILQSTVLALLKSMTIAISVNVCKSDSARAVCLLCRGQWRQLHAGNNFLWEKGNFP